MNPKAIRNITLLSLLAWGMIWLVTCAICRADDHRYDYPVSVKAADTSYVIIPPDSLRLLNPTTPVYYRYGNAALMVLRAKEFNWKPKKIVQIAGRFALSPDEMDELTKYLTDRIVADSLKKPLDSTLRFK